ncbi:hypothetical protein FO519_005414 [Halicephalobus sp. NKZ332]|nr:hypothetical protein FO519_005414 [Halicephalobus sp. NKZ332]
MVSKFFIAAVVISLGFAVASEEPKTKDENKKIDEISMNELATLINTLVEQTVAERESEPLVEVIEVPSYPDSIPASHFLNSLRDGPLSLPVHNMDSVRSDDVIAKRARTFQYYGSRGKKAVDYSNGRKLFNYMPSRG